MKCKRIVSFSFHFQQNAVIGNSPVYPLLHSRRRKRKRDNIIRGYYCRVKSNRTDVRLLAIGGIESARRSPIITSGLYIPCRFRLDPISKQTMCFHNPRCVFRRVLQYL